MDCGFRVIYGYTQSDEISLLFHPQEDGFGRKMRKYLSILAGEASAFFTRAFGDMGCFDARLSLLPTADLVVDYFRWRNEDAHRNALNAHCYWLLRKEGLSANEATQRLVGITTSEKNQLLFQRSLNFDQLPLWQKRGVGLYHGNREKHGMNPKTGKTTTTTRRCLEVNMHLPMKEEYSRFVRQLIELETTSTRSGS